MIWIKRTEEITLQILSTLIAVGVGYILTVYLNLNLFGVDKYGMWAITSSQLAYGFGKIIGKL